MEGETKTEACVVDHGDDFTFSKFLAEVSSNVWSIGKLTSYIREMSPRCFWITPDRIAIKRATPSGDFYIEKHKISDLNLPKFDDFDLQSLMIKHGKHVEDVCDLEEEGFLATCEKNKIKIVKKVDMKLIKPILEFILEIWANGDKQKYEYILAWFHEVFTGCSNYTALLLYSDKILCGKNFLLNWMKHFIFGDNWYESNKLPTNANKQMVVINSNERASKDVINELIDVIDNGNVANYVITTTSLDAFPVAGTGRFMCLEVNSKYSNDTKYFRNLWNLIAKSEVASHFYTYITDYEGTEESRTFISTDLEKKMTLQPFEMRFLYMLKDYHSWDKKTNIEFWKPLIDEVCVAYQDHNFYRAYCGFCKIHSQIPIRHDEFKRFVEGKYRYNSSSNDGYTWYI